MAADSAKGKRGCSPFAIFILVLLAYGLAIGLSFLPGFGEIVQEQIQDRTGREVKLGQAHLDWRLDVVLRKLSWTGSDEELSRAEIDRVALRWNLVDSFRAGELRFRGIDIAGMQGHLQVPQTRYSTETAPLAQLLVQVGAGYGYFQGTPRTLRVEQSTLYWEDAIGTESASYYDWENLDLTLQPIKLPSGIQDYVVFQVNMHPPGQDVSLQMEREFFVQPTPTNGAFRIRLVEQ